MPHIFAVRDLTRAIREVLEAEFPFIWVRGQIGQISRPGSGHIYLTLKDEEASINVVWFKSNQISTLGPYPDQLSTGMEVICSGRLAVYGPRGVYQLIAEFIQERGLGRLHLEFQALKKKLSDLGYFDPEKKSKIPFQPSRIGIITAPSGAAIRDFLKVCSDRGCSSCIRIYPSLVQGEGAADNIAWAIEQAHLDNWAQVLVIIRGGGSLEDLWTFNSQEVAEAIYQSKIPVLTGIGHEIDTTIADLVADLQTATPSQAAQILWPERTVLTQKVDEMELALQQIWITYWQGKRKELLDLEQGLSWLSPKRYLQRVMERLESLCQRLSSSGRNLMHHKKQEAEILNSSLKLLNPLTPLQRGYCLVKVTKDNSLLRSASQVASKDQLEIKTWQDRIWAEVQKVEQSGVETNEKENK